MANDKVKASLERVQNFDVAKLPRESQLGEAMNFLDAVEPARRIINLFRQFPIQFFNELPDNKQNDLARTADAFHQLLTQVETFDPKQASAWDVRQSILNALSSQYQSIFNELHALISYGASRTRDFDTLERDFRASMQRAQDASDELMKSLQAQGSEGQRILEEVRQVAAETGVSQQARYFRDESGLHQTEADKWRKYTVRAAIGLAAYAFVSVFAHKLSWISPSTTYETVQLAISKILIFAVLAYVLALCARNFLSHKHNEIVNKHRQNALLTFKALVDAAGSDEKRDIILAYAAACIFSPQDTGYSKSQSNAHSDMPVSIIQAIPKLAAGSSSSH